MFNLKFIINIVDYLSSTIQSFCNLRRMQKFYRRMRLFNIYYYNIVESQVSILHMLSYAIF